MDYRIEQLRHQLREDPSSRVFYQLGEILRREGSVEEAVQVLRDGLTHHPRYVAAWVSLGRALLQLESWPEAELAFARALELDPENAVAARMIGEASLGRGDLVRAVKAFKLARALSPRDPTLEEQIATVEAQLEEQGLLEPPLPARPPAQAVPAALGEELFPPGPEPSAPPGELAPEPVAPLEGSAPGEEGLAISEPMLGSGFPEPLATGESNAAATGGVIATPVEKSAPFEAAPVETAPEVFAEVPLPAGPTPVAPVFVAGTDEDPFSVGVRSDTGVHYLAEDVFGATEESLVAAGEAGLAPTVELAPAGPVGGESAAAAAAEVAVEHPTPEEESSYAVTVPGLPFPVPADAAEQAPAPDALESAAMAGVEPGGDSDEPEVEVAAAAVPELPLPTLTLARLALAQGDSELAEGTLVGLLEHEPGNAEAARLLAELRGVEDTGTAVVRVTAVKVVALQGWLERFRLAAERLGP